MQVAVFNEFTRKVRAEISAADSADVIKTPTKLCLLVDRGRTEERLKSGNIDICEMVF